MADSAPAPHARECELHEERRRRVGAPRDGDRQHITLGVLADIRFDLRERKACFGNRRERGEPYRVHLLILRCKPAPPPEPRRQHFRFEQPHVLGRRARLSFADHDGHEIRQRFGRRLAPCRTASAFAKKEPQEAVWRKSQQIGQLSDRGEHGVRRHLDRHRAVEFGQIEFDGLRRARQVRDAQDGRLAGQLAQIREDLAVARLQEADRAASERVLRAARRQHAARPVEQRMRIAALRFDVDGIESIQRAHHGWQHELFGVGAREAAVSVGRPLHRRAHAVAVAEVDVVAHAEFVAVIDDGRARHRQQQRVDQLDTAAIALHQRRETAADAEVQPRAPVARIRVPQVVTLGVRDHFEREFIVIAQEDRPLVRFGEIRRLLHDVGDREAVLARNRHVDARHQREVERHMAFVFVAEVFLYVFRPLVRFGEQHPVRILGVDGRANLLQDRVRLRQILVVRAFAFDEIRHGIQPQTVDAHVEPEAHHLQHFAHDSGVVEVQVRLVRIEAMPVVLARDGIVRPVRRLRVDEDDARLFVFLVRVGPHVIVAMIRAGLRAARALEPRVLIGRVVDDQFGDHAQAARMRFLNEALDVAERTVIGMHAPVVGDVVAVVAARRRIERQQPDRAHTQFGDVVELRNQAGEIADAVVVRIEERLDVHLVDDRVLVPERIVGEHRDLAAARLARLLAHGGRRIGDMRLRRAFRGIVTFHIAPAIR
jgi:hypothetical protein